jgi:hypothetical protein
LEASAGPVTSLNLLSARQLVQEQCARIHGGIYGGGELTSLQAANRLVLSLGFITLGDNRRNAAASSAVTVLCHIVCVEASAWYRLELN